MGSVHVIILAAGEGSRMKSRVPKVLHPILGRPMVRHVADAALDIEPASVTVVVSPDWSEQVGAALEDTSCRLATQDPPRGTGDAVACGLDPLASPSDDDLVLVVNGDCPGLQASTLEAMVESHADVDATFLAVTLEDPTGYGRMVRDRRGDLARIVEEADCDPEQLQIRQVNAGIYLFRLGPLRRALERLSPDNAQGELYLTDTLALIHEEGGRVGLHLHDDAQEVHGVNTRQELARAEELLLQDELERLMDAGVSIRGPVRVDAGVDVGADTVLYPGVVLESGTRIGAGCVLYPNVRVARSRIGNEVMVYDGTVVEDSEVEDGAFLGPYARLRPGAHVCEGAKVGNFVEMKASRLGKGSKASHLTYLGNAEIGDGVNVGAGTITCNYDGVHKHRTVIENGAFIGSNTALVAPVRIGAGAYVGAGSTITKDVPPDSLGIARGRQRVKEGWAKRKKKDDD